MEFLILGTLEVVADGHPLDLGGAKQRTLLASLLLEANRVVSADRLIDAVWDGEPPETAPKALQGYVSHLRRLLGRDRLATKGHGYVLCVNAGELDRDRFERLAAERRPGDALALWRGPPLCDFAYQRFAQADIARLQDLRLACLEERFLADLDAGRHASIVGELDALVREHPLREHLRGQLMLALYRAGRQAEALEVYQTGRRLLSDELGLEPGEELKSLQRRILAHDPALDQAAPATRPGERPELDLVRQPPRLQPARAMRKTVTVVVAVLSAASRTERLDPEAHRRVSGRAFAAIRAAVEQHGGTVETLAGGALTAILGIPVVHEDDALRAVRAAVDARAAVVALADELRVGWGVQLDTGLGVSTGEVVAGGDVTGDPGVTGEPIVAAGALARAAAAGQILLDETTHRLVRHAVDAEPTETAFSLFALHQTDAGVARGRAARMVGRGRERRRLEDALEQAAADRSCQLFTILGPAGVGKSRLVEEFVGHLPADALVIRGRCLAYGEGITYWPLLEAVRQAADLAGTDDSDEGRRKIAAAVDGEPDAQLIARRVAETIGLEEASGGTEERFWAVRTFFETLARTRPLVLVFDDIHSGEPTFLDLVEHIAEWTRNAAVLLVCLARAELLDGRPGWGGGRLNATSILLEPLSQLETTQLVAELGGAALGEAARARIVTAAEGNPLFAEEMLALALEAGRGDGEVAVPPTIQSLLAARLDRLADGERVVLEVAAVEGRVFHEGSVAALLPREAASSVRESLRALVRKELIREDRPIFPGQRAYRFRHQLIRDAAYDAIPKEPRAALHQQHADWLEREADERRIEYGEIVGYHLERAYRYRAQLGPLESSDEAIAGRAADRLHSAGRRAFGRGDMPAAANLLGRAALLLPHDDPRRLELLVSLGLALMESGELPRADSILTGVIDAAIAGDRRGIELHARLERSWLAAMTDPEGRMDELEHVAGEAIPFFERTRDPLGLTHAWFGLGMVNHQHCQGAVAIDAFERALRHAQRAGDDARATTIVTALLPELAGGPTPVELAIRRCRELLDDAPANRVLETTALGVLGLLEAMRGGMAEGRELCQRARELGEELGLPFVIAGVDYREWNIEVLAGDHARAARAIRRRFETLAAVGEKAYASTAAAYLACALVELGALEEALHFAQIAQDLSASDDLHSWIPIRLAGAGVLRQRGDLVAAEKLAREAVALGAGTDWLNLHATTLESLAGIMRAAGRTADALELTRAAVRLYEQKGNVVSAVAARAALQSPARVE